MLVDQSELFRAVALDSTCWRPLVQLDTAQLATIGAARAATRKVVLGAARRDYGVAFRPAVAASRELPGERGELSRILAQR